MKDKISKLYKPCVIEIFLLLFPVIEVITSVLKRNTDLFISPGIIYKSIFVIYALIYLIVMHKKNKKCMLSILAILVFCIVHMLVIGINSTTISNVSKMLTFLISALFFYFYRNDNKSINLKALIYCTLIYCVLIKIAQITGTAQATYRGDLSLGTKGWFYSGNELSAILAILLPVTIMYAAKTLSYLGISTVLLQIHTLLSIGTKTSLITTAIIILLFVLFAIIWCIKYKSRESFSIAALVLILSCFTVLVIPNTASYKFFVIRVEENTTPSISVDDISGEEIVDDTPITDFSSFILNGRGEFLKAQKELYSNTNILEKLFGTKYENRLGYNYDNRVKTIEIDMYDLVINFGMIGCIIFYFPIVLCIFQCIYNIFHFKNTNFEKTRNTVFWLIALIVSLAISCIAGHVLTSSTIEIFVAYIIGELFLKKQEASENILNER